MQGNVKILYDGIDIFNGICPAPLLFFEKEYTQYGSSWGSKYNFSIEGQITGRLGPQSFYDIEDKKNRLLGSLLKDNLPLTVEEDGNVIFTSDICSIQNISFDESKYYALLPFSISASCYDSGSFGNNYGVMNPVDSWSFSEEQDGRLLVTHSISADGFDSSANKAINNAKNWVSSRTGVSNKVDSFKINNIPGSCYILDSISESIDRFNGSYSVQEKYVADLFDSSLNCSPGILRYTIDTSKNSEDGLTSVSIEGSVIGKNKIGAIDLFQFRDRVKNYDFFSEAVSFAKKSTNVSFLNSTPYSRKIVENENNSELSFSLVYDDNPIPPGVAKCIYKVSLSENLVKNIVDIKLDADIICDRGDISSRWDSVNDYYRNNFNGYSLAIKNYSLAGYVKSFSSTPISESINFDKFNAKITYSADWSDRYLPYSDILVSISENVSISPSIYIYTSQPSLQFDGVHNVQNIGSANRTSVSISIEANAKPTRSVSELKSCVYSELERLKNIYVKNNDMFIDNKSETVDVNYRKMSLNYSYSFNGDIFLF